MNFQEYIKTELFILIPVLYLIGMGFKKSTLPDRWIPCLLGILAVLLSAVWVIATSNISSIHDAANAVFTSATQGVLLAGASVYANQLYLQSKKKD